MTVSTSTGSGAMACLLIATAVNETLRRNQSTSLLQSASETVTTSGGHVAFLLKAVTSQDEWCQLSITVDGTEVYNEAPGGQDSFNLPLTAGDHVVTFTAFAFNADLTVRKCGLTVLDLGI